MKKIAALLILLSVSGFAEYRSQIFKITPEVRERMIDGNSYKKGFPSYGLNYS